MEATITTLGDVFKKKVEDIALESYDAPTIWIDPDGNEHEDTEFECINVDSCSLRIPEGQLYSITQTYDSQSSYTDAFNVNGIIKQVGSHVKICHSIFDRYSKTPKYPYDLSKTFRYAKNLEELYYTFDSIDKGKNYEFSIPEDIFWHCPNLKKAVWCFSNTKIKEIPENLFAKNPKLENLASCFNKCRHLTDIPENLFKNNSNLKNIVSCFEGTSISKIPDKLFEPLKDKIESTKLNITACFRFSALFNRYKKICNEMDEVPVNKISSEAAQKLKKEGLAPDYLSEAALVRMIF